MEEGISNALAMPMSVEPVPILLRTVCIWRYCFVTNSVLGEVVSLLHVEPAPKLTRFV